MTYDHQPNAFQGSSIPFTATHRKRRKTNLIILVSLGIMFLACGAVTIGSLLAGGGKTPVAHVPLSTYSAKAKVSTRPVTKIGPKPIAVAEADIPPGTWAVGSDVKPGHYVTTGASNKDIPLCYWDVREKSEAGQIKVQGVKNTPTAQGVVTLVKGDYFTTSGCKAWKAK
jgi:hypothetical protein